MILIERIYSDVAEIAYISQDDFSVQYCNSNPSYLRSMKCRQKEPSTVVLVALMENLHRNAVTIKRNNTHKVLHEAAVKYEALANEVGEEIARRSMEYAKTSAWVRERIISIVKQLNAEKQHPSSQMYNTPPIIIC